jgi:hypothetical protein
MIMLPTWSGRSKFQYSGSLAHGIEIHYGEGFRFEAKVNKDSYSALLAAFAGKEVPIGTSRTAPPDKSVGAWLKTNVSPTALASYVGPILIHQGYATRGKQADRIRFS